MPTESMLKVFEKTMVMKSYNAHTTKKVIKKKADTEKQQFKKNLCIPDLYGIL